MAQGSLASLMRHLRRAVGASSTRVPDAQLLERFLTRQDEAAFELLVRRHERMVLGVCRRVLRHMQDAEDAFQATFLTLACKASSIGKREALASWLYKVAFRIALRARTRASKRARHEQPLAERPADIPSPEPWADGSAVREMLDEEIHRLPAKYRAPVILCYLEGKTNEEAALLLGCPTGTVVTHLARARRRLRHQLARRGLGFPVVLAPSSASPVVPAALVDATLKAATFFASNRASATSLVSANVAILTKGALRAMLLTKLKIVAAILLTLGVIGAGSGVWTYRTLAVQGAEVAPDGPNLPEDEQPAPRKKEDAKKTKPDKDSVQRDTQHQTVKEVVTKSFKTGKAPRLVVELFNGSIDLVADAEGSVQVRVTKQGGGETGELAQAALKNVDVKMTQEDDTVRVTASLLEENKKTNSGASAEVRVPPGAVLELQTSNGAVSLQGGSGKADVKTSNGPIQAKEHKGSLHLATSNGPITVAGGTGRLDLKTSNGGIKIHGDKADIAAHTSNGSIQFQGTLAVAEHSFHTSNGSIVLALPADARFRFEAETTHGTIVDDFSGERPHKKAGNHLAGTVGQNPSTSLKLSTSNGNIALQRQDKAPKLLR